MKHNRYAYSLVMFVLTDDVSKEVEILDLLSTDSVYDKEHQEL